MSQTHNLPRQPHHVWDRSTRIFHWVNVICVLLLIVIGVMILNGTSLGISPEGKVSLKILHAWTGYVFTLNLLWRLVWGFFGGRYSRWRAILPGGRGYIKHTSAYLKGFRQGDVPAYKGHNPLGRIMIVVITEVRERSGLVSAMFSGIKYLDKTPED